MIKMVWVIVDFSNRHHPIAGCLAGILGKAFPVFIETGLNALRTRNELEMERIVQQHPAFEIHRQLGLSIANDSLIGVGNVLEEFIHSHSTNVSLLFQYGNPGLVLKRLPRFSLQDASRFLAKRLECTLNKRGAETAVLEIGSSPLETDGLFVLQAIQILARENQAEIRTIVIPEKQELLEKGKKTLSVHESQALRNFLGEPWLVIQPFHYSETTERPEKQKPIGTGTDSLSPIHAANINSAQAWLAEQLSERENGKKTEKEELLCGTEH
jgi:hypothetical protein